jgi:conjugative transfer signal peptidase TraF
MSRYWPLLAACAVPATLAFGLGCSPQPAFLVNVSRSEPLGLYVRTGSTPSPGQLAAFRPPGAVRAYVAASLPEIGPGGILKTVVGGAGDLACVSGDQLRLNGRVLGPVLRRDRHGRAPPRWTGCRALEDGEYLVFSDRIPNSFDSRYYGPIPSADLIGAYAPLWVKR